MNDYALARWAVDIPLPGPSSTEEELLQYGKRLFDSEVLPTHISGFRSLSIAAWKEELGFTLRNVDQDLEAGRVPIVLQALKGRFDAEAIEKAVTSDSNFGDLLEKDSYRGVFFYTWGEDLAMNLTRSTAVRIFGRGNRLMLSEDYLFWVPWTDGIREMVDALQQARPSLADLELYKMLVTGLTDLGVYTAYLSNTMHEFLEEGWSPEELAVLQEQPMLVPYRAYATGTGVDEVGPFTAIVIVHLNDTFARLNVRRLEQRLQETSTLLDGDPWSSLIDNADITSEGPILMAKLRGPSVPTRLYYRIGERETLLLQHIPYKLAALQLYRNEALGFSISYPEGWEVDESDSTSVVLSAPSSEANPSLLVQKQDLSGFGLVEWANTFLTVFGNLFDNFYVLASNMSSSDGEPSSIRVEAIAVEADQRTRMTFRFNLVGESVFMIVGAALEPWYAPIERTLRTAVDSFTVLQVGDPGS